MYSFLANNIGGWLICREVASGYSPWQFLMGTYFQRISILLKIFADNI